MHAQVTRPDAIAFGGCTRFGSLFVAFSGAGNWFKFECRLRGSARELDKNVGAVCTGCTYALLQN